MIFHMTCVANDCKIMKLIIGSVIVNMMNVKFINCTAKNTKIGKLSQGICSITKLAFDKIWIVFSNLIQRPIARGIKAIDRTINIQSFPPRSIKLFVAVFAILLTWRVSSFISTRNRTKFPFFSGMVREFFKAYSTNCITIVMKIVAQTRTINSVNSMISIYWLNFVTKFTGFLSQKDSYFVINHLTIRNDYGK